MRSPIIGHAAQNLDAQRVFPSTFENIINRRVDIPDNIRRFQKTLQHVRSKVDYAIGEFIYMIPSDMSLRIGKIRNYNNKILISSSSFNIGTYLKVNLNDDKHIEKDKLDVKSRKAEIIKTEPDVKSKREEMVETKPDIKSNKEHKQDIKMINTELREERQL